MSLLKGREKNIRLKVEKSSVKEREINNEKIEEKYINISNNNNI